MRVSPYIRLMRLDKPIGIWLLFWPCIWGLFLGQRTLIDCEVPSIPSLILMFLFGSMLMRSAGCVINDIIDRDIDPKVERTKTRPIAAGEVSVKQAVLLTALLCGCAFALVMFIVPILIPYSVFALLLVISYPFMKRITWWPQAFLGLTFNMGILFGGIVMQGEITLPIFILYLAGICWTIGYDTIYAHQDIEDDLKIGVKSTAIRFGSHSKTIIALFYTAMIIALCIAIYLSNPLPDALIYMLPAALHVAWQCKTVDLADGSSCLRIFKSNQWLGAILAACIALAITQ